jgi:hopene-associated glycosyltransferase HpnB
MVMDWSDGMTAILLALGLSGLSWIYLLAFRGRFWQCDQRLALSGKATAATLTQWPSICAIVPARNEADMLTQTLPSLLTQNYPGDFRVLLVDDQSTDGTAEVARQATHPDQDEAPLEIMTTAPLPQGWSGKLWAVHQGIEQVLQDTAQPPPDYFLLTDADILHGQATLKQLALKAEQEHLGLVSLMVLLRCQSFWEKLLIPAFVFFFQKLYPFPWVNQPQHSMAAAAGGCVLVCRETLTSIGGIEVIRKALIDDCALGAAIKGTVSEHGKSGRIWLGLTTTTISLRPYPSLQTIWSMVARTAFTQLHYSFGLLLFSLISMVVIYLIPPMGALWGAITGQWAVGAIAAFIWSLMTFSYWPTIRLYRLSPLWTFALPLIAMLYTLMTVDSAVRHLQGRGGAWKGRVYATDSVK